MGQAQLAIEDVFGDQNMKFEVVNARQLAADDARHAASFDFPAIVEDSFLPSMIQLCQDAGVELILVRLKRRAMAEGGRERAELAPYLADLQAYLDRAGVTLIDFSYDPRITIEHFAIGDHLDRERGAPVFTRLLAERLAPHLPR
jgi:hypothetical protein